jgi:hypothetical protein
MRISAGVFDPVMRVFELIEIGKGLEANCWQTSFTCRCSAAILDMNEKHGWRLLAYDALRDKYGWPVLSQRARQVLERAFAEAAADSERRRNPEVRKAANRQRLARHHKLDEATGADLPAYGDGEDQEIEMTIPVAPPDHGMNLNIFGFKNPGYQCHLCALLSCMLSIGLWRMLSAMW